jgi:hypothetical protein
MLAVERRSTVGRDAPARSVKDWEPVDHYFSDFDQPRHAPEGLMIAVASLASRSRA